MSKYVQSKKKRRKKTCPSQNKSNAINIFVIDMPYCPYPPTVIPFLLVDSCLKNKIRTNEPEIH